jgi:hypothetical protein
MTYGGAERRSGVSADALEVRISDHVALAVVQTNQLDHERRLTVLENRFDTFREAYLKDRESTIKMINERYDAAMKTINERYNRILVIMLAAAAGSVGSLIAVVVEGALNHWGGK